MLCIHCGQNVPTVPCPDEPDLGTCLHCKQASPNGAVSRFVRVEIAHSERGADRDRAAEPPPQLATPDDWASPYASFDQGLVRVDAAKRDIDDSSASRPAPRKRHRRSQLLQWTAMICGLALFTCGAILIANSFATDRVELWDLGAPCALAGQVVFLVGLILQLDLICFHSFRASDTLHALEHKQNQNRSALQRDGESRKSSTADRPDTSTLLADLEAQLEQIGAKLRRRRNS